MIHTTLRDSTPDGRLVVVSPRTRITRQRPVACSSRPLGAAPKCAPDLAEITEFPHALDTSELGAPCRGRGSWLDGSAYPAHGELMDQAIGVAKARGGVPALYRRHPTNSTGPMTAVRFPSEDFGIDFEGEFGVIVDAVPMGEVTPEEEALRPHPSCWFEINDWSLRTQRRRR